MARIGLRGATIAKYNLSNGAVTYDTPISGGCARTALDKAGIKLYGGVRGDADEAVDALLSGELKFDPNPRCTHHDCGGGHSCH